MALEDFGGAFDTNEFFTPAMGRLLSTNPEALIPHFAAAGIAPPTDATQLASLSQDVGAGGGGQPPLEAGYPPVPYADRPLPPAEAPTEQVPASEPLPPGSMAGMPTMSPPYTPPTPTMGDLFPGLQNKTLPFIGGGGGGDTAAAATAPGGAPSSQFGGGVGPWNSFGDLGGLYPLAVPPSTPSSAGLSAGAAGVPLPPSDPRLKGPQTPTGKDPTGGLLDALSGVKMPPGPPAPQVRPHTQGVSAMPQGSPIAALLSGIMSGTATPQQLRLLQAIGKEGR